MHLHTSKAGALGRLAPGLDRNRIIYTMHGYQQLSLANPRLLPVDRGLIRRTGSIVAVSENDRLAMAADGYTSAVIRNGTADSRLLPPPGNAEKARIERVRSSGLPVVMMIARDAAPKRVELARDAARLLNGFAEIVWIGGLPRPADPPNFTALESDRAAACLRLADIFLLLSDHEGLPAALLEAMSAGLPSVASAVDGCLEVLGGSGPGRDAGGGGSRERRPRRSARGGQPVWSNPSCAGAGGKPHACSGRASSLKSECPTPTSRRTVNCWIESRMRDARERGLGGTST